MQNSFKDSRRAAKTQAKSPPNSYKSEYQAVHSIQSENDGDSQFSGEPKGDFGPIDTSNAGLGSPDLRQEQKLVELNSSVASLTSTIQQLKMNNSRIERKMVVRHEEIAALTKLVVEYEQSFDSTFVALTAISKKLGLDPLKASIPVKSSKLNSYLEQLCGVIDQVQDANEELNRQQLLSRGSSSDQRSGQADSKPLDLQPTEKRVSTDLKSNGVGERDAKLMEFARKAHFLEEENLSQQAELLRLQSLVTELEKQRTTDTPDQGVARTATFQDISSSEAVAVQEQLLDKIHSLEDSLAQRFEEVAILTSRLVSEGKLAQDPSTKEDLSHPATALRQSETSSEDDGGPLQTITKIFAKRRKKSNFRKQERTIRESGEFDAEWYLNEYPDVREAQVDPLAHYIKFGAAELRNPNAEFNTAEFVRLNPSVVNTGLNPFFVYITQNNN